MQGLQYNSNHLICVLRHTFEPIEIQNRSAPLNNCLNLSFRWQKIGQNGQKTTIYIL